MPVLQQLLGRLATQDACLVQVESTQGSAPRDAGAWMAVFAQDQLSTIGGGHLEWEAANKARDLLASGGDAVSERFALGPRLGQCCGGVVHLRFQRVTQADCEPLAQRLAPHCSPVAVFGAGHVGAALVQVLSHLPLQITWVDSREALFPTTLPANVQAEYSDPIERAVADLAPGSSVFILTHDHQQDLQITQACLQRQRSHGDLDLVGLIGSATKRASFAHRLAERGFADEEFARITCPIGVRGIQGKAPEVIAIAVAAQLLQHLQG
ncbi:xanthine dehydrogenase accessory protein XdhC [Comamonas piscis]|uniref:Xanthine dehydrogenase accessory protein XdhC n=1 Tax=Comamonas piscis TaxID=1562974 RepID=A0A7G5EL61_9BURK|nr:xanthine dehydrogenase accessory protein XdhC [Comamonas piscis]QMV74736.1 xanthine dehydrogenase accessory protein XdhC [Comamonas piscis]WSO33202.1 xanthine dehydrogenase accessory protein XdhC [Comamonas piscis]